MIIRLQSVGLPSSVDPIRQIVNSINLEFINNGEKPSCSEQEVAEAISRLLDLKIIRTTWVLGISTEEMRYLLS
jgi:hypothetical protein